MVDTIEETEEVVETGRQMELLDHLTELRSRLIRVIVYIVAGTMVGWFAYDWVFKILSAPVQGYLKQSGDTFLMTSITEPFVVRMQVSLLVGIALAIPLVTFEAWKFIAPGLTKKERRGVRFVAPLSVLLFAGGVALGYWILPVGINWFASLKRPDIKLMPQVSGTLLFIAKMCLAFGLTFQLPVILMFLARVGIVSSRMLISYWRHAIIILAIVAAVVTPSNDAFSMSMMCIPLIGLYGLSILLVRTMEK